MCQTADTRPETVFDKVIRAVDIFLVIGLKEDEHHKKFGKDKADERTLKKHQVARTTEKKAGYGNDGYGT